MPRPGSGFGGQTNSRRRARASRGRIQRGSDSHRQLYPTSGAHSAMWNPPSFLLDCEASVEFIEQLRAEEREGRPDTWLAASNDFARYALRSVEGLLRQETIYTRCLDLNVGGVRREHKQSWTADDRRGLSGLMIAEALPTFRVRLLFPARTSRHGTRWEN